MRGDGGDGVLFLFKIRLCVLFNTSPKTGGHAFSFNYFHLSTIYYYSYYLKLLINLNKGKKFKTEKYKIYVYMMIRNLYYVQDN